MLDVYGINESVYGLFMDESSTLIILTIDQFEYLIELIPEGADYKPIDLKPMMEQHYGVGN